MYNYRVGDDVYICVKGKVTGTYVDCIIVDTNVNILPCTFDPQTGNGLEEVHCEDTFLTYGKESPFNDPQALTIVYLQGIEEGKSIIKNGENNGS